MNAAAERALRAHVQVGGMAVRLRVPAPGSGANAAEQMGLATPAFADVELGRGVFRRTTGPRVLLLTARGVEQAGAGSEAAAEAMFAGAAGVVIGDTLYGIETSAAMRAGDGVYGYALTLAAPLGGIS